MRDLYDNLREMDPPMTPFTVRSPVQTWQHWVRVLAVALVVVGLMLLVPDRAAASFDNSPALRVIQVQQDGVVGPPGVPCGSPVWTTSVSFDPNGWPISNSRFGSGPGMVGAATIDGLSFPPGTVSVDAVVTWDGHPIRHDQSQASESVRLEFSSAAGTVSTGLTSDLADNVASASSSANLGSFDLPDGATEVRIVHSGAGGSENSVVVTAVCLSFNAAPEPTIVPTTSEPPATTQPPTATTQPPATTEPPTTDPPGTEPPATDPPVPSTADFEPKVEPDSGEGDADTPADDKAVEPATEVKGETELARTGPNGVRQPIGLALTLMGLGLFAISISRRRERSDST